MNTERFIVTFKQHLFDATYQSWPVDKKLRYAFAMTFPVPLSELEDLYKSEEKNHEQV